MPRKRPIQPEAAAASSNSHRKKPVIGPDWRQNLFYLHGDVYTDGDETVWEGTWLASEESLPSARQFAEAPDSFKLTTRDFLGTGIFLEEHSPIGRSGKFSGLYKVNYGERKYSDIDHRMVVMDHTAAIALVAERGTSEYGEYVSLGRLIFPKDGLPATITLARRYIPDDDPRARQSPWEGLFRIASKTRGLREKDDFVNQAPAPWKLLPQKYEPPQKEEL
jgi:hypothetical protein